MSDNSKEFVPVRVSTLRGDVATTFDLYVPVGSKNILYIRRGDSFEGTRLNRFKEKNVKKLFIELKDEANYREYIEKSLARAYDPNSGQSIENRAEVIQGHTQASAARVMDDPKSKQAYDETKQGTTKYIDFLLKNDQALKSILSIQNTDKSLSHHGVNVASLAVLLGKEVGIDPKTMQLVTLGALLHDIGHSSSGLDVARPLSQLTGPELETYKNHPRAGAELVRELRHFDEMVIRTILEHEETLDGRGFPQKLSGIKIDRFVQVVGLANAADRLISFEGLPRDQVAKQLMTRFVGRYPLDHLKFMSEILTKNLKADAVA